MPEQLGVPVTFSGYYSRCCACRRPMVTLNGVPDAPGGVSFRRSLEGVIYVTPHAADCPGDTPGEARA